MRFPFCVGHVYLLLFHITTAFTFCFKVKYSCRCVSACYKFEKLALCKVKTLLSYLFNIRSILFIFLHPFIVRTWVNVGFLGSSRNNAHCLLKCLNHGLLFSHKLLLSFFCLSHFCCYSVPNFLLYIFSFVHSCVHFVNFRKR